MDVLGVLDFERVFFDIFIIKSHIEQYLTYRKQKSTSL